VLFVADTSGSMGPADRRAQRAFIESSLRLHRAEDNYEISFRVLGVTKLRIPLIK
jgi:hypothetical protein